MQERGEPPAGLRVLITNRILLTRTGTEVYVRDLAASLLRRGHLPIVYSPHLGEMAAEIRAGTVPVVDDSRQVGAPPDIIHGHHGLETLAALLAFPGVPAVDVCHSWLGWPDAPVIFPRVARYLAVDHTCRDRLVFEHGLAENRVHVRLNAVDLARFLPRGPLPVRPARALVFSNAPAAATSKRSRGPAPREDIALDVAGYRARARARAAAGRARPVRSGVRERQGGARGCRCRRGGRVCDVSGVGPMITTRNLAASVAQFRDTDIATPPSVDVMAASWALRPADAAAVSRLVRDAAGHETLVDELLDLYAEVLAERRGVVDDPAAEMRAAGRYLEGLAGPLRQRDLLHVVVAGLMRLPLVPRLLRWRASRERPGHPLAELLATLDRS